MTAPVLFPSKRVCVVCKAEVTRRPKVPVPGEPLVAALNVTIYRRGRIGRQLVTTNSVQVCEPCLAYILASRAPGAAIKGRILAEALYERIANRYSAMCEAETA